MKRVVVFLLCLFAIVFCGCTENQQIVDNTVDMKPRLISVNDNINTVDLVEQVKSAVVGISATGLTFSSVGSGVAISEGGYILTNEHVISGARSLRVYFADRTDASATVVWKDAGIDLAIIKTTKDIPYLSCKISQSAQVGEDVIAIGTPLTLDFRHTVTKGIVSALNRTLEVENENGSVSYMQNLIQHDASINPGNSGGPLINSNGEVIGINTLKATDAEGIGFAIPISVGKSVLNNLKLNTTWTSAYMGVFGLDNSVASFVNEKTLNSTHGVYVSELDKLASGYMSGLRKGDVIIEFNNNPIKTVLDLRLALYNINCGETATIKVIRDAKELTLNCKLCPKNSK